MSNFEKPERLRSLPPTIEGLEEQGLREQIASERQVLEANMDEIGRLAANADESQIGDEQKGFLTRLKDWHAEWQERRGAWAEYYNALPDGLSKLQMMYTMEKPGSLLEFLGGKNTESQYKDFEKFLRSHKTSNSIER